MEYTRTFVFKEIKTDNQTYFQWFKVKDKPCDKEYIELAEVLSEWEHWERLTLD